MVKILLDVTCAAGGIAAALALGLFTMRQIRRSNPQGAAAIASALMLFMSPCYIDKRGQDLVEDTIDETKRKKDSQSGDPPVIDG